MWIYLTRHAETEGNIGRIVQTPDTALTARGHKQAQALADHYKNVPIKHILCSDYARAQNSAKPLQEYLSCNFQLEPLLRERNFGDLRGKHYSEVDQDFFSKDYCPPNGETYPQFVQRVKRAWQSVLAFTQAQSAESTSTGDVMLMTHGLVVRCVLTEILQLPAETLSQIDVQNTCVTKINSKDISDVHHVCDVTHLPKDLVNDALEQGKHGAV